MREILFRGKRVDNGEWVEGYLVCTGNEEAYILDVPADFSYGDNGNRVRIGCFKKVDFSTLGQHTGLQDKNGNKIFDSDIVSAPYWRGQKVEMMKGLIEFSKGAFSVVWQDTMYGKHFAGYVTDMVIIGNIFDNPELWEE